MLESDDSKTPDEDSQMRDVTQLPAGELATKIAIPQIRADLLRRPDLARRLEEAIERGLVLVSTPAGFGKSDGILAIFII